MSVRFGTTTVRRAIRSQPHRSSHQLDDQRETYRGTIETDRFASRQKKGSDFVFVLGSEALVEKDLESEQGSGGVGEKEGTREDRAKRGSGPRRNVGRNAGARKALGSYCFARRSVQVYPRGVARNSGRHATSTDVMILFSMLHLRRGSSTASLHACTQSKSSTTTLVVDVQDHKGTRMKCFVVLS